MTAPDVLIVIAGASIIIGLIAWRLLRNLRDDALDHLKDGDPGMTRAFRQSDEPFRDLGD